MPVPPAPVAAVPAQLRGMAAPGLSTEGRRLLAGLADGSVPGPAAAGTLRLPPATGFAAGRVTCSTRFEEPLTLTPNVVFGGWIACLVDHFAGLVMLSALPDGTRFLTSDLNVTYHAPLRPGPVEVRAELSLCTTRLAVVEVAFAQDGRTVSTGRVEQILHRPQGVPGA
ncbi:PaaI family thioesterase [Streptomyces sp. NPDC093225]|uniref:PaaI family thioesterase n=1 Tax=Streptomyces sp. NPDC093225 TaxID=3366034 RepID=UPI003813DE63